MVRMCIMCEGASRDEALFDLHAAVTRHGWGLQAVEGHDPPDLDWVYSVGLAGGFGHPELVVMSGQVQQDARLLNELGEMVRSGRRFEVGDAVPLSGGLVGIGAVHPVHIANGLVAVWQEYYEALGPPVPALRALQVVLPDGGACHHHQVSVPLLVDPTAGLVGRPRAGPNRAERRARARRGRS